jgi:Arm domain-containing DNA-binding protein
LAELAIKNAKAGAKIVKLLDGGGLQLWITPDGAKRWRKAYRFNSAQKTLAVGVYPDVGLRDARHASESAKRLLAAGLDPSRVRKSERAAKAEASANTFAVVAVELVDKKRREAMSEKTITKIEWLIGLASPLIGYARSRKSRPRKFSRHCGPWSRAADSKPRADFAPPPKYFGSPYSPGGPIPTRQEL